MTDREKLIELLCESNFMSYDKQADHLIANGVTFATDNNVGDKWIPVSDRLPDERNVLAVIKYKNDRRVGFARYEDGEWLDLIYSAYKPNVTHWMYIPDLPKGE